eukprot:1313927-Pleurochrysis_carterae.AAC.2
MWKVEKLRLHARKKTFQDRHSTQCSRQHICRQQKALKRLVQPLSQHSIRAPKRALVSVCAW